ncbi:MAG: SulP family inorganic anion transporter [Bacteroidetes bacterium]|nr:SulP family inorganic anion transporter [Bacteroidota bacterium]
MSNPNSPGLLSNIRGDFFGGLTAGIVALPLALAFGLSSGLGPDAGLYGAIFLAFFAALFGGTNTQISGPTAPMTAVSMIVIAGIVQANGGNVSQALPTILTVFLIAGLILVLLGFTGVGKYIKYMPYPVVSGFMTAIGVIIIITQLLPMMGYYAADDEPLIQQYKPQAEELLLEKILRQEAGEGILVLEDFRETVRRAEMTTEDEIRLEAEVLAKKSASGVVGAIKTLPRAFQNINWTEFWLALITILIIYGFKRITTTIPSTLVALLIVSGAAYWLQSTGSISYRPIPEIPSGFPALNLEIITGFSFGNISPYLFPAFTLALLGAIDSLLTSVVADNMTKTRHDPNKELIGQGIGNSIAAFFGGIPGAGATIRTVVNINAGGKTRLSGMIAGLILLAILLVLGPIASQIPAAVLAGILITVGIGVMDYKGLKALPTMPKSEVAILLVVMILAVVWNLVYAVGIGLVIASLVFMKKMGDLNTFRGSVQKLREVDRFKQLWPDEKKFPENLKEEVFLKHLDGPLFFGYTTDFLKLSREIPLTASHVIIRMDRVPYMDQSGLFAMEDVLTELRDKNITILVVGLKQQPRVRLEAIDIIPELLKEDHIFEEFGDCLSFIKANVVDRY